ncbi:MAG: NAD(P)H-dependent oxidoreductase [Pseudomonadales bacterium]
MSRILHIEASPKGERSGSSKLAAWFLDAYRQAHPQDQVEKLNVFDAPLPAFGADAAHAKFAPIYGEEVSASQKRLWEDVKSHIARLDSFDKIVLSSPMWNYSVPYPLKHYLDIIMQPGITFGYDPKKMIHIGLLKNRPVQLLLTRSSTPPGDYGDFQLPYLRFVFSAMGLTDLRAVTAWQTTKMSADERASYLASFETECREMASVF